MAGDSDDDKNDNMFQLGDAANAIKVDRDDNTLKLEVPRAQANILDKKRISSFNGLARTIT